MTHVRRRFPLPYLIIPALLALGAIPLMKSAYRRYAPAARYAEARGRMAFILTAARSYAEEHESDNDPATADWPDSCGAPYFLDDCAGTENFSYDVRGRRGGALVIRAEGRPGGRFPGVRLEWTLVDFWAAPTLRIERAR